MPDTTGIQRPSPPTPPWKPKPPPAPRPDAAPPASGGERPPHDDFDDPIASW
ncbi:MULTISPECIES: hypothetical protein [unclassified Corallococcus]|uniref:hypothetical protein n=1 Tax=unclassified Corallococcus TaxID=2685029 RepID=UPI001A8DF9E7|nr:MULTISPECIES: hypothetical protein [unclassified Corallococcus]MBN9688519.1 hypothetical protein [Corallococcus sp. NCSPR001]WAS87679.1 hypothetical protein O0N60_12050 [Corallococcus sp. NCRR]